LNQNRTRKTQEQEKRSVTNRPTHHEKTVAELDKGGVAIPWNSVAPPETGGYILEETVWMKGKKRAADLRSAREMAEKVLF
jgi:hypothetical protein